MCRWIGKALLFALVLLSCCWYAPSCSAATITLTEPEKQQLMQNFVVLDRKLQIHEQNLDQSAKDLLSAEKKLAMQEEKLLKQEERLSQYESVLSKTEATLKRCEESLTKAEKLLNEERTAHQREVKGLKTEALIWKVVGAAAVVWGASKH